MRGGNKGRKKVFGDLPKKKGGEKIHSIAHPAGKVGKR